MSARTAATLTGPVATRALVDGARGHVRSVFERSLYVALSDSGKRDALVCIGPRGLGAGPLNLLCEAWPPLHGARARVGDAVLVKTQSLWFSGIEVALDAAAIWNPPSWARETNLADGLKSFAGALPELPAEGLARLMLGDTESSLVLRAARAPSLALADFIRLGSSPEPLVALIGLGPGLTPAGDDFLGGAMIALAALGRTDQRDALWRTLVPQLASRTTDISAAHLSAAAEGLGSEALHLTLNAIVNNDDVAMGSGIAKLAAIGHTSGLDALSGAIAVLRALSMA